MAAPQGVAAQLAAARLAAARLAIPAVRAGSAARLAGWVGPVGVEEAWMAVAHVEVEVGRVAAASEAMAAPLAAGVAGAVAAMGVEAVAGTECRRIGHHIVPRIHYGRPERSNP